MRRAALSVVVEGRSVRVAKGNDAGRLGKTRPISISAVSGQYFWSSEPWVSGRNEGAAGLQH